MPAWTQYEELAVVRFIKTSESKTVSNLIERDNAAIQPVAASKVSKNPGGRSATWLQWIVIRSLKEVVG